MQKRLATVERRSKELAGVFVKYEKANIERMEVRMDLFSSLALCLANSASKAGVQQLPRSDLPSTGAHIEPRWLSLLKEECCLCLPVSGPSEAVHAQRFAERVHDKFLELDKHLGIEPAPIGDAAKHARDATASKKDTSAQESSSKTPSDKLGGSEAEAES